MRPAEVATTSDDGRMMHGSGPDLRLLSSVCHDMKAPLARIVVGAGFLRKVLPKDNAAALRVVDAMHRAASRMDQLIVSFGDLGRLQTHELKLDLRMHALGEVVQRAFDQLRSDATLENVNASLEMTSETAAASLSCDRSRLLQIMTQLTACVLRVIPEGSSVTFRVTADDQRATFEVEGKLGDDASRRIGADLPSPQLAIAKGLVELHGGEVTVLRTAQKLTMSFSLSLIPL